MCLPGVSGTATAYGIERFLTIPLAAVKMATGWIPSTSAEIAQMVEQRTENPRVASSILALGTSCPETLFAAGAGKDRSRFWERLLVVSAVKTCPARAPGCSPVTTGSAVSPLQPRPPASYFERR